MTNNELTMKGQGFMCLADFNISEGFSEELAGLGEWPRTTIREKVFREFFTLSSRKMKVACCKRFS